MVEKNAGKLIPHDTRVRLRSDRQSSDLNFDVVNVSFINRRLDRPTWFTTKVLYLDKLGKARVRNLFHRDCHRLGHATLPALVHASGSPSCSQILIYTRSSSVAVTAWDGGGNIDKNRKPLLLLPQVTGRWGWSVGQFASTSKSFERTFMIYIDGIRRFQNL
ncbi:hypothetical protein RRG08_034819 [Elysia crispata]|uniref:Uncharacterized protein n=1 Tax=Elysia crispata TaxID=231223 RepID=A0AAE1AN66_9GAST|nr:hypothetical protein RRG08_034819 [Elysia crispata]